MIITERLLTCLADEFVVIIVYHNGVEVLSNELQHKVVVAGERPKRIQVTDVTTSGSDENGEIIVPVGFVHGYVCKN